MFSAPLVADLACHILPLITDFITDQCQSTVPIIISGVSLSDRSVCDFLDFVCRQNSVTFFLPLTWWLTNLTARC